VNTIDTKAIQELLDELPERYAKVLNALYLVGKTRDEVAKEFNYTSARVDQIEHAGLRRLSRPAIEYLGNIPTGNLRLVQ